MSEHVIIGFDAEWTLMEDGKSNHVLSYQYAGRSSKGQWSGIQFTQGPEEKQRLTLEELIGAAIEEGRKAKLLPYKWPTKVYAAAHLSRADISALRNFNKLKYHFDGVAKTFATITAPYKTTIYDRSKNKHPISIHLIDTLLLTPNQAALAVLGDLYDFPKLSMSQDDLERMDLLLEREPERFKNYAIRDAEISALHAETMISFAQEHMGISDPPTTLGGLAVKHVRSIWEANNISENEVLGKQPHKEKEYSRKKGRYFTSKKPVSLAVVHENEALATKCFHGGRNEAYVFGITDVDLWSDVDLMGAYTTAMAAIKVPDYGNLQQTTTLEDFKHDELGLARIEFKFPDDTRFPALPVRSANGLPTGCRLCLDATAAP